MQPRLPDLSMHLLRIGASTGAIAMAEREGAIAIAAGASVALFFAAFALMHDAAHGALRLPRKVNELVLSTAGALMLMSGHALRLTHLRHHARPLAADDIEGAPARLPFARALAVSPFAAIALRVEAFRSAKPHGRRFQAAESALNVAGAFLLVASGRPALIAYVAVAVALQLSMAVWAAHIPHNAPAWLLGAARRLSFTRSPIALSLGYHELHHSRPDLPCGRLAQGPRRS